MMKNGAPALILAAGAYLLLILLPGQSLAVTWKARNLNSLWEQAAWDLGQLRIQPAFLLTNAGYDSNVLYAPRDPIEDYTFTLGPAFDVFLRIKKKLMISFYASPRYVHFFETKRERSWNYHLNGSLNLLLNRFFLSVGGVYTDARQRINTEIDIRPRRKEKGARASLLWQPSKRLSFSVEARRSEYDHENVVYEQFWISERLDRTEDYANFTIYYQLGARTRFFADMGYGRFDFQSALNFRDSESRAFYGGFEFSPAGKIRGNIRLGYKEFDAKLVEGQDYSGLVGDTGIQVRLLRSVVMRAEYRRDVRFSLYYGNVYFLENRAGGGLSVYVTKRIRLDYDYSLGRNKYPGEESAPVGKRLDEYKIHTAGIYFRLKRNIGLGLTASRWIRDSNIDREDNRRDFFGLNLIYDF